MKAENAVRMSDNLVGIEVHTIQDVVKAQAAGLNLLNKDGLGYEYEVINEESGEEREPTEQEIFNRIAKDLAENAARRLYDLGALENGELESVAFDVEEQGGRAI